MSALLPSLRLPSTTMSPSVDLPPFEPAVISAERCRNILDYLRTTGHVSLSTLIRSILHHHSDLTVGGHTDIAHFASLGTNLLENLLASPLTGASTLEWVFGKAEQFYQDEVAALSNRDSGFHFNATNATEDSLTQLTSRSRRAFEMKISTP